MVVPSPSRPLPLKPQQYAAPLVVTPQEWSNPALTAAHERPPVTGVGTSRRVVGPALSVANVKPPVTGVGMNCWAVVPSPNWPELFKPQQKTWPDALRAHEWKPPAPTVIGAVPVARKVRGLSAAPGVLAASVWSPGV